MSIELHPCPGRPDGADRGRASSPGAAAAAARQPVGEEPGGHHEGRHADVGEGGEDPVLQESLHRLSTYILNHTNQKDKKAKRVVDFTPSQFFFQHFIIFPIRQVILSKALFICSHLRKLFS